MCHKKNQYFRKSLNIFDACKGLLNVNTSFSLKKSLWQVVLLILEQILHVLRL